MEEPDSISFTTQRVEITKDNLPKGNLWEEDGACWKAVRSDLRATGREWRWQPMNWLAFAKEGPEGEMHEFLPGAFYLKSRPTG